MLTSLMTHREPLQPFRLYTPLCSINETERNSSLHSKLPGLWEVISTPHRIHPVQHTLYKSDVRDHPGFARRQCTNQTDNPATTSLHLQKWQQDMDTTQFSIIDRWRTTTKEREYDNGWFWHYSNNFQEQNYEYLPGVNREMSKWFIAGPSSDKHRRM